MNGFRTWRSRRAKSTDRRNPLWRKTDRIQAAVTRTLIGLSIFGAPLVAVHAGESTYRAGVHAERVERTDRWPDTAELLADAGDILTMEYAPAGLTVPALAAWTGPDGVRRTGYVQTPPGTTAGSTVTVWMDRTGAQVDAPRRHEQTASRTAASAALAVAGLLAVLLGIAVAVRHVLHRRRLADWEAEWARVEPLLTGR